MLQLLIFNFRLFLTENLNLKLILVILVLWQDSQNGLLLFMIAKPFIVEWNQLGAAYFFWKKSFVN